MDGKTARGSFDGLNKAVHLLSLVAHESGLTVAQTEVPHGGVDKTNEHKTALRLLEGLVLEGRLITGDAMFCQRDLSQADSRRRGALPVVRQGESTDASGRHPGRLRPFRGRGFFPLGSGRSGVSAMDTATTLDKGHGRRERRTLRATTALNDYLDWPGVAQVGEVNARWMRDGERTEATRYFITSVPRTVAGASELLRWARGHWSIENRSHYVRDVTLGEDASRIRKGSGPEVMAAFRNVAIGFLRSTGVTNIAEALRRNAARVR